MADGAGGIFEGLFGEGSVARQFFVWGVAYELIRNLVQPLVTAELKAVNARAPEEPLSPAILADLVLRGWIDKAEGATQATQSGVPKADFEMMVKGTGEPPGLESVLEWYRRGFLPWDAAPGEPSVLEAVRTSRIITSTWGDVIKRSNLLPIPLADAVDAVVEGQITRDEGVKIAYENGIDADNFTILYNTRGNPPAPTELLELFRRGFIPMHGVGPDVTSVQQGILEGATKDKWEPVIENLATTLPSMYYVLEMSKSGAIPEDLAQSLYAQLGLPTAVATALGQLASGTKVAKAKNLAEGVITTLYYDQAIAQADAVSMLATIGYNADEAGFILEVQDLKREESNLNAAITKLRTLFIERKLTSTDTLNSLNTLGVPAAQVTNLMQTWTLEQGQTVKLLTETQIADAYKYLIIDQPTAEAELVNLGYTPYDAWVILSVTLKAPQGPAPQKGPSPAGNIT